MTICSGLTTHLSFFSGESSLVSYHLSCWTAVLMLNLFHAMMCISKSMCPTTGPCGPLAGCPSGIVGWEWTPTKSWSALSVPSPQLSASTKCKMIALLNYSSENICIFQFQCMQTCWCLFLHRSEIRKWLRSTSCACTRSSVPNEWLQFWFGKSPDG